MICMGLPMSAAKKSQDDVIFAQNGVRRVISLHVCQKK